MLDQAGTPQIYVLGCTLGIARMQYLLANSVHTLLQGYSLEVCSEEPRPGSHVHLTGICMAMCTALELTYTTLGLEPDKLPRQFSLSGLA